MNELTRENKVDDIKSPGTKFQTQSLSPAHKRNFWNVFGYASIGWVLPSGIARHVGAQNDAEGFSYAPNFRVYTVIVLDGQDQKKRVRIALQP